MDSGKAVDGSGLQPDRSVAMLLRSIQQSPLPFAITRGAGHTLVSANAAFRRLTGLSDSEALGQSATGALTGILADGLDSVLDQTFRSSVEQVDVRVGVDPTTRATWMCSVWPVIAPDGSTEGLGIQLADSGPKDDALDMQREIAQQMLLGALRERSLADHAEESRRRAAFLAEAGRQLAESADQKTTLVAMTKLALPRHGDWCIVDVLEDEDVVHRLGIYHSDLGKQRLANELEARWKPEPDDPFGAAAMLRNIETIAITEDVEKTLVAAAHGGENLDILHRMGVSSLLSVPLVARSKLLGAITFVTSQRDRGYDTRDIQLAEDLACRAALALDNAQMFDAALVLTQSAESANRAKTAFLGAMSHELRTPLNAIGGYIDLLDMGLRGPVTEQQHADFARVRSSQQHLLLLITEILNFARAEAGGVSYVVEDVNAQDTMTNAMNLIEPLFAQRGLVFDGITGDSSVIARADPDKVTQILVNLLSNAIKFTPAGGHIGASYARRDHVVTMQISDTGIGIDQAKLEGIFEPFVQLKDGLADRASGVGLGLAISRDLARAMKGELSVTSKVGKGSRFTLTLPRASTD